MSNGICNVYHAAYSFIIFEISDIGSFSENIFRFLSSLNFSYKNFFTIYLHDIKTEFFNWQKFFNYYYNSEEYLILINFLKVLDVDKKCCEEDYVLIVYTIVYNVIQA
jgi:hypothetical protein